MKKNAFTVGLAFLAIFGVLLLVGCATMFKPSSRNLMNDKYEISVIRAETRTAVGGVAPTSQNYYVTLTVKNMTSGQLAFDSADFELKDVSTGISYYSISKGNEYASASNVPDLLTKSRIDSGKTIQGTMLFPTAVGGANGKQLMLTYDKVSVRLD